MSSNNLCHSLVLKIHSVVEIQTQGLLQKNENSRRTVTRNEKKTFAV